LRRQWIYGWGIVLNRCGRWPSAVCIVLGAPQPAHDPTAIQVPSHAAMELVRRQREVFSPRLIEILGGKPPPPPPPGPTLIAGAEVSVAGSQQELI
jgi:hypothetical protein